MSNKSSDGRVRLFVFRPKGCEISEEDVRHLLDETGGSFEDIIFLDEASDLAELDLEGSEVLIVLDQHSCGEAEPEEVAIKCRDKGADVIVVFGDGVDFHGLHPIAEKYGNQCTWSADDLFEKICNPKTAELTAPSGSKPERDQEKPVKC